MSKKKFIISLFIAIVLTLGLSISVQSLLAAWTPPSATPPNNNLSLPISKDASGNVIIQLGL